MRDAPEQTCTPQELDRIEDADEMGIASRRADGSLRSFITIWFVRGGDGLYVRSAHGPRNGWFRRALASGHGRVRVGNWEHDVAFKVPDAAVTGDELHRAFHTKYDHYGPRFVDPVVSDLAVDCTLRLVPR